MNIRPSRSSPCSRQPAGWDFAALLAQVAEVGGIRRVRYTTSHPRDFGKQIVDAMDAAGAGRVGAYERCAFSAS